MNLAFFYEGFDTMSQNLGGSIYLMQLGDSLTKRGFVVSYVNPFGDAIRSVVGTETHRLSFSCLNSVKPAKVLTINKFILSSAELFKFFDVIHSVSWSSIPSLHLVAKHTGSFVPFIFDCRTSLFNVNRSYNLYKLMVFRLFKPSCVIFCDERSFMDYRSIFGHKGVAYIPTPVDTQRFRRKRQRDDTEKFRILFASSLSREKGLLELLKAVEEVWHLHSDVELVLAGDGPLREYVLDLAVERDWLRYLGLVDHSRMPNLLNSVDLLIHPSHFEGLSRTVLEGLSCEVPVIATDVGGHQVLEDVVRLVPASSPRMLSEEILYMLDNEDMREQYTRKGRKYVEANNSWDHAVQQIIRVYETLTGDPKA